MNSSITKNGKTLNKPSCSVIEVEEKKSSVYKWPSLDETVGYICRQKHGYYCANSQMEEAVKATYKYLNRKEFHNNSEQECPL